VNALGMAVLDEVAIQCCAFNVLCTQGNSMALDVNEERGKLRGL
jgi:hypothetical protein